MMNLIVAFNLFSFPSDASFSLHGLLDDATNFQLSLWGGELGVTFCGVSFCCLCLRMCKLLQASNPREPLRAVMDGLDGSLIIASHGITKIETRATLVASINHLLFVLFCS